MDYAYLFYRGRHGMPLAGNLSDSFGRKKIFMVSLILFTASSLACGLAPSIYTLIAFRFIQGVGGGSFLPTASSIVSDHFPENRETAIGLFTSVFVSPLSLLFSVAFLLISLTLALLVFRQEKKEAHPMLTGAF